MTASHKPGRSEEALWAQLCDLPEHLKGEIIDGKLIVQSRPRPRHARVIGKLFVSIQGAFDAGREGPGGWWILVGPGIELPGAREIVPDIAGWRRSTLPDLDLDAPLTTRPDWACEVLSPTNTRHIIVRKQGAYARAGVEWLWLVNPDPQVRALQVFRLVGGPHDPGGRQPTPVWLLHSTWSDELTVRVPPFEDIELPLAQLWL